MTVSSQKQVLEIQNTGCYHSVYLMIAGGTRNGSQMGLEINLIAYQTFRVEL